MNSNQNRSCNLSTRRTRVVLERTTTAARQNRRGLPSNPEVATNSPFSSFRPEMVVTSPIPSCSRPFTTQISTF